MNITGGSSSDKCFTFANIHIFPISSYAMIEEIPSGQKKAKNYLRSSDRDKYLEAQNAYDSSQLETCHQT